MNSTPIKCSVEARGLFYVMTFLLFMMSLSQVMANVSITNEISAVAPCTDPVWTSSGVYVKGNRVSYNSKVYEAKWWTQNENPETKSAAYDVWLYIGTCGGTTNVNPSASITLPANNAAYNAPATVTINATASDSDGTIVKVEFFQGTTKLGEDTSSPYSYSWGNVAAGSYSLTAKASDNAGGTGTSSVINITVNSSDGNTNPTTSITSPINNATFTANASITIAATAADNGTVSKVDFYNGNNLLGTDTSSPYSYIWTNVGAGTYSLKTIATDNLNATGTSATVNITVIAGGGSCTDPQYVEAGGYVAGSKVKNVGNSYECKPYPYTGWCNGGAAAYAPGTGTNWQDAWTLVGPCSGTNNNAPSVSITAPANNATYTSGQTVSITASASDTDGTVTKVEFFVDGSKIGEDVTSPYSFSYAGSDGVHTIKAKATDNSANATESNGISITIGTVSGNGSLPKRIMVGYWHTWGGGVPFIKLRDVNSNWDVINISFSEPVSPGSTDGRMKFVIAGLTTDYTTADFKADVKTLQSRGKKVVLSIGGYEGYFSLMSAGAVTQFVNDIKGFVNEYGFNGIDIDLEQSSVQFNSGQDPDFKNPTSPRIVNMISAIRQIVNSYDANFILSWAPETFYLQMGKTYYGGLNANVDSRSGCYIPMIHALRDKTTFVHAQLYNSAQMQGPDGTYYTMGTTEGIVAMCELVLQGFNVNGNASYFFPALRPDQVVIGVPSSQGAAGSGQISNAGLQQAFTTLKNKYPALRGIMAWSINWDALQNSNSFVISNRAYLNGAGARETTEETNNVIQEEVNELTLSPNPVTSGSTVNITLNARYKEVHVSFIDLNGAQKSTIYSDAQIIEHRIPTATKGLHLLKVSTGNKTWTKKIFIQ